MTFSFQSVSESPRHNVSGHNDHDGDGNPAGGYANDIFHDDQGRAHTRLQIYWQKGPLNREDGEKPNGAFVEDVLLVCKEAAGVFPG